MSNTPDQIDKILAEYEIGFSVHGKDINRHLASFKQALYQLTLTEVIGENTFTTRPPRMSDTMYGLFLAHNGLRAEQRQSLAKLFNKEKE